MAVVGYPERAEDVHNAAAVLAEGRVQASYRKLHLPNYGVFDELRYFQPGTRGATIEVDGVTIGPDGRSLLMADDVGNVIWRVTGA